MRNFNYAHYHKLNGHRPNWTRTEKKASNYSCVRPLYFLTPWQRAAESACIWDLLRSNMSLQEHWSCHERSLGRSDWKFAWEKKATFSLTNDIWLWIYDDINDSLQNPNRKTPTTPSWNWNTGNTAISFGEYRNNTVSTIADLSRDVTVGN